MNDELRDDRRAALIARMLDTQAALVEVYDTDSPADVLADLARRVSADLVEMHLALASEVTGLPFLRSLTIARAKLRGVETEHADLLAQCLTIADLSVRAAATWTFETCTIERAWASFYGFAGLHASMMQSVAIMYADPALEVAAAEGKAIADVRRSDMLDAIAAHEAEAAD